MDFTKFQKEVHFIVLSYTTFYDLGVYVEVKLSWMTVEAAWFLTNDIYSVMRLFAFSAESVGRKSTEEFVENLVSAST